MLRIITMSTLLCALAGGCGTAHFLATPKSSLSWLESGHADGMGAGSGISYGRDGRIQQMLNQRAHATLPASVAVFDASPRHAWRNETVVQPEDQIRLWREALSVDPGIESVHAILPMTLERKDSGEYSIDQLRATAARMGCQLLLVYTREDVHVTNYNDAAALYWTLVGLWVVPGSEIQYRSLAQAALVDVGTGMILGTAVGDELETKLFAAAYESIQHDKLAKQVPAAAMAELREECRQMMTQVVQTSRAETATAGRSTDAAPVP